MITGEIKSQIDKIWESFWTGGVSNPLTVIEQFTYLLFIRRLDETQIMEEKKANMIKKPVSNVIFTPAQQELRWSSFKNKDPETMFDLFNKPTVGSLSVFEHMKQVGDAFNNSSMAQQSGQQMALGGELQIGEGGYAETIW